MNKTNRPTPSPIEIVNLVKDQLYGGDAMSAEIVVTLDTDGVVVCWLRTIGSNSWIESWEANRGFEIHWTARATSDELVRPDRDTIKTMLETIAPLLERVHAGHTIEREYGQTSGVLSEDAREAVDHIQYEIEATDWWTTELVTDGYDWLEGCGPEDLPVTASSTDEELKALAKDLTERAYAETDYLLYNLYDALADIRERLKDEEDA